MGIPLGGSEAVAVNAPARASTPSVVSSGGCVQLETRGPGARDGSSKNGED